MALEDVSGFDNYTSEIITELRHMFADEKIDSRPIKYESSILWLDAQQRLHRLNGPAVEKQNGIKQFWIHGEMRCGASDKLD